MDSYVPILIKNGLKGMIGKGARGLEVLQAIKEYHSVYFGAVGGAGAFLSKKVIGSQIIAFEDLGTEAIHRFEVVDFPVVVINDIYGGDLYKDALELKTRYIRG